MDYLITEGYPSAAEKFAAEANIQPKADFSFIQERVQIRDSIYRGDLQAAIELINELNPEVSSFPPPVPASFQMIRLVSCTTHSLRAEMRAITPSVLSMIFEQQFSSLYSQLMLCAIANTAKHSSSTWTRSSIFLYYVSSSLKSFGKASRLRTPVWWARRSNLPRKTSHHTLL